MRASINLSPTLAGGPMKFLTLADWTGMLEAELFAQTHKSHGLATVRYLVSFMLIGELSGRRFLILAAIPCIVCTESHERNAKLFPMLCRIPVS